METLNCYERERQRFRSSSRKRSHMKVADSDGESSTETSKKTRSGDSKPPSSVTVKTTENRTGSHLVESESEYESSYYASNDSDYYLLHKPPVPNHDKLVESGYERFYWEARMESPDPWIAECAHGTAVLNSPIYTAHQPPLKSQSIRKPDLGLNLNRRREEQRAEQRTEPLIRAAWAGDFAVCCGREERPTATFGGLRGCVSSKACAQARVAVERLPASIGWEKLPKWCVWPKSFERCGPTENDIAVFFFPSLAKDESVYESLVFDLIRDDLAMRTTVMGAELLLFTSVELPPLFTRFQGKLYLWGVFRGNQPQF